MVAVGLSPTPSAPRSSCGRDARPPTLTSAQTDASHEAAALTHGRALRRPDQGAAACARRLEVAAYQRARGFRSHLGTPDGPAPGRITRTPASGREHPRLPHQRPDGQYDVPDPAYPAL